MDEEVIQEIISTIEDSIASFQKQIPGIQTNVFDALQNLLGKFATKGNNILASATNLKLIGSIQNEIQKIIENSDYMDAAQQFINSFNTVETLQNKYFAAFNSKFTPGTTLKYIKTLAVQATVNSLVDQGLSVNIVDPVTNILRNNITSGGTVSQLSNQLRTLVVSTPETQGHLEAYTTQITTDALNQYSAQYNAAVAQDLGMMNWGRYVGSNIKTSREFCIHLTKKQWVKRTELAEIIQGNIDGYQCKLNKRTGLPDGMIAGTNTNNFSIYRGGYNCGHQFFWVPDAAVPDGMNS